MKKHIVFFEAEGGSDKGPDGHCRDTMPMVNAVKAQGCDAEVIFYMDEKRDEVFAAVSATAVRTRRQPPFRYKAEMHRSG